jgi:hypothetical protein
MSLPFKLSAQNAGTRKAHSRFVKQYGKKEGERIFLAYADDHGTGSTIRQKVNSIFKKGSHVE